MRHSKRRLTAIILVLSVCFPALAMLCSCGEEPLTGGECNIRAAVFGSEPGSEVAYNQLRNGIMANIDVKRIYDTQSLDGYDIVYLDSDAKKVDKKAVMDYVYNGGTVVLDNSFVKKFSNKFLGAEDVVKLEAMPLDLSYSYTGENLTNISELLYDYTSTIKHYGELDNYYKYDYGYGIIPSTAKVIAGVGDTGVYTKNSYGDGDVFITNPMLPSDNTVTQFTEGAEGEPMAFSTVAAENLLRSYFAEYVSKKKYGFAVERTYGSFASSPAAWELHYEDITGIENKSLIDFADYCIKNNQMPSFTLVRNAYTWFKRAESVTYLEYDNGFKNDAYEGAYCSGTHIVSAGEWLELDSYTDTESYFEDNQKYTKRAYPFITDWNEDGNFDIICGSADGRIYYFEGYGMRTNYETGPATHFTDDAGGDLDVGDYSSPVIFDINGDGKGEIVSGAEDGIIRAYQSQKTDKNPNSMAFSYIGEVLNTGLTDSMISCGFLNDDNIMDLAVGSRTGEMRVYYGYTEDGKHTLYGDFVPVETNEKWVSPCIHNGKLFGGSLEGYVAEYYFDNGIYKKGEYLKADTNSRRGNKRVTIGMNSVPRFFDIDGDGDDDLLCGSLEYGMAYPIDSEYFPYSDELNAQLDYCMEKGIYIGAHGLTHKYASPEQEIKELKYHKAMFDALGLKWEGVGINQHTWYTSNYGYDGSGINGYNPDYDGTFNSQSRMGLLWNSGSTLPESSFYPQDCAENAIPMPMYLSETDFLVLETCNTPHGNGAHTYASVKYEMPLLFYNHCDYMYEDTKSQKKLSDKVGELVDKYDYVFVREDQLAKSVSAAYNTDIKASVKDGVIKISDKVRNENRRLYDEDYTDCIGVRIVFADKEKASAYKTDANVYKAEGNTLCVSLDKTVTVEKGKNNGLNIKGINLPATVKLKEKSAVIDFKDGGEMIVRVAGRATTKNKGWTVEKDGNDTVFIKFGKAEKLKISK
ncbi:MAG: hypothetical protein IJC09_02595 [Clostridia bacterium]|nr:hypothetical protein [Clostridia bacterium]